MKPLTKILLLTFLVGAIASCKKNEKVIVNDSTLVGKWKLTETWASSGTLDTKWTKVAKGSEETITFNRDGKLEGSFVSGYKKYAIVDTTLVSFIKTDNTIQNYRYKLIDGYLTMSPAGPIMCIEGCGYKFTRTE